MKIEGQLILLVCSQKLKIYDYFIKLIKSNKRGCNIKFHQQKS